MAEVAVGDLRKSFGRTEVLKGVSVAVSDGEMMVVLGPRAAASPPSCASWPGSRP